MSDTILTTTAIEQGEPLAKIMLIGPETAERWLTLNKSNRRIRPNHVAVLAHDMRSGGWQITGEAIKFDKSGNLIDGQHRLSAIVESRIVCQMLVISGLQPEAQQVMDSGAKRTAADALGFAGHAHAAQLSAAARLCLAHERGELAHVNTVASGVSHSQVLQFIDLNPDIHDAVALTQGWRVVGFSHSAATAAALRLIRIDRELAERFFTDVMESRTTGRGDPRSALIHRFQTAKARRENVSRTAEMWCIFRCWNGVRTGESLKLLKFGPKSPWVEPR